MLLSDFDTPIRRAFVTTFAKAVLAKWKAKHYVKAKLLQDNFFKAEIEMPKPKEPRPSTSSQSSALSQEESSSSLPPTPPPSPSTSLTDDEVKKLAIDLVKKESKEAAYVMTRLFEDPKTVAPPLAKVLVNEEKDKVVKKFTVKRKRTTMSDLKSLSLTLSSGVARCV